MLVRTLRSLMRYSELFYGNDSFTIGGALRMAPDSVAPLSFQPVILKHTSLHPNDFHSIQNYFGTCGCIAISANYLEN